MQVMLYGLAACRSLPQTLNPNLSPKHQTLSPENIADTTKIKKIEIQSAWASARMRGPSTLTNEGSTVPMSVEGFRV